MKVIYGHTDSIYCTVESVDKAKEIAQVLNTHVQQFFPNTLELEEHPVVLEFEKYFRSLGVGSTKNRNAGLISWKDGKFLEEDEFFMTGFIAKRVSETKLAKDTQLSILRMWVENKSESEIVQFLQERYQSVLSGHIPINQVLKRSRYHPDRFKVKCLNCKRRKTFDELTHGSCCNKMNLQTLMGKRPIVGAGVEGVIFYNSTNKVPITDSYLFCRVKDCNEVYYHPIHQRTVTPNYVAGLTEGELSDYTPDWEHYAESVLKKAEPIFRAMNWNVGQISKDSNQRSLDEWF